MSKEKRYQELGSESLQVWCKNEEYLQYFLNLIPVRCTLCLTTNLHNIPLLNPNFNFFKNSLIPFTIIGWRGTTWNLLLENLKVFAVLKTNILNFIQLTLNCIYFCHGYKELKLMTRLRLDLSHLQQHKSKYNSWDTINPLCSCSHDIESIDPFSISQWKMQSSFSHYFHYHLFFSPLSCLLGLTK